MKAEGPAIEHVGTAVYVIPTDAPEADGTLAWTKTTLDLMTVTAGSMQGIGWTYAAAAAGSVVADVLADAVIGRSAFDIPGAAKAMARAVRNIGREGVAATAISAVDVALWDLKARILGPPVTGLLGRAREQVPVYGSGGFTSYGEQQTRDQLSKWVEEDRIPRVKIKIGEASGRCAGCLAQHAGVGALRSQPARARRRRCPQPAARGVSTTISASSSCCSMAPSIPTAACSPPIPASRALAWSSGPQTQSNTGKPDKCRPPIHVTGQMAHRKDDR